MSSIYAPSTTGQPIVQFVNALNRMIHMLQILKIDKKKRALYSDSPRLLRILHITRASIQVFQTFVAARLAILLFCIAARVLLSRRVFPRCVLIRRVSLVDICMHSDAIVRRHTLRLRVVKPDLWRDKLAASRRCSRWRICRGNLA
jgi:hypothetical protein